MPNAAAAVIRDQSPPPMMPGVIHALLLSWLFLLTPKALPRIPVVRFPGFPWLIAAAWLLPNTRAAELAASEH